MKTNRHNLKFAASISLLLVLFVSALVLTQSGPTTAKQPMPPVTSPVQQVVAKHAPDTKTESAAAPTLKDIFRASIEGKQFEPHSAEEVRMFESLLRRLLNDATSQPNDLEWLELGWVLHRNIIEDCIVIAEHPSRRIGRGLYAIRTANAVEVMIQAPHRFHDQKTGVITTVSYTHLTLPTKA